MTGVEDDRVSDRMLRNTVIVFGYGRGSEGGQFLAGSSWSF